MRFEVEMRFVRDGQVVRRGTAMIEIEADSADCLDTLLAVLPEVLAEREGKRKTYTLNLEVLEREREEGDPWTIHETPLVSVA